MSQAGIISVSGGGGGGSPIEDIIVQTGISPVVPTANAITFNGSVVAAGTNPVRTDGTGVSTMALEVQISQAVASTDATKIGLSNFDSADFTVDANGFVALSGAGAAQTFTTQSGVATPSANNINIFGGTGATTSASGSTVTVTVVNDSFAWSEQNLSFAAAVQNGYYCNAGLTVTLPATAGLTIGNTIIIYVDTSSTVTIQANTGQMIQVGDIVSISGGSTVCSTQGGILELNFKPSDTTWHTIASMGSWATT